MELLFQISFLILSSLFTGIVLFLSTVLLETFNALTEEQYYSVYSEIIVRGRKSIVISTIVLVPILIFSTYIIYGFRNLFFLIGALLYILGSFVSSRFINEPAYTKLLKMDTNDRAAMIEIRDLLNKGNITRTVFSLFGILLVGISIYWNGQ
ncbi:hypothetical protein WA1_19375 [Scytonema hofmannii PCC 7110]|uniref:DUF1772 domain-containing protein n=1 Tax=Scytonema hofmannii PCC 7110 TaxID=128403 RepID=A0A139XBW8_9CYAN|nr:DUF1772 domain-containing protein [Scytonema hofmannii]KYC42156.1 hypothetical protein WA1_19375 [Scytonema hofmannii PCC 7110]